LTCDAKALFFPLYPVFLRSRPALSAPPPQDYINFQLTGRMVASACNAAVRWHWRGGVTPPLSLLAALDLSDLAPKWPSQALAPGALVGGLTPAAAAHLGLPPGLRVAQGGADAFIGMLGLGVLRSGELALLTGSSHLHLGIAPQEVHGAGVWGSYEGALPLAGAHVLEGGQTSTGSVAAWFRRLVSPDAASPPEGAGAGACEAPQPQQELRSYASLDAEASLVPPGAEGLLCQEHFQGNRTPHTDPASRGVLLGLTLRHGRAHIFRAILEGVAFGTRAVLEAMAARGFTPTRIVIAGGAARSSLWLQITADVTGLPLCLTRCGEAPALGAAALAAVCGGAHASVEAAVAAMVHVERTVVPDASAHAAYAPLFAAYQQLYFAAAPVVRAAAAAAPAAS
jgi:ribulose kinase